MVKLQNAKLELEILKNVVGGFVSPDTHNDISMGAQYLDKVTKE